MQPPRRGPAGRLFAALGGALFVASLAYFAYFYLVVLDLVVPETSGHRLRSIATDAVLFGVFALHHSVFARSGVKRWITRWIPTPLERATYVWVASLLFVLVCYGWAPVAGPPLYEARGAAALLCASVQVAGLSLVVQSTRVLDPLELAGIRQARGEVAAAAFRVVGPYHWIRHPLYLGWTLFVFGAARMTPTRWTFAVISSAYLILAIPWEERSLAEAFGDDYRRYRQAVRWRVLPFIY